MHPHTHDAYILSQIISISTETSQTTLLDLGERPAAAQKCDKAHDSRGWQCLEEVPASVVQEKDTLHCQNGAKEQGMRHRRIAQSLAQVAGVCTECCPSTEQDGKCGSDRGSKHNGYDFRRRSRIRAEDVVNLRLSSVSQRGLGDRERDIGIASDLQVEHFALVGRGGTE